MYYVYILKLSNNKYYTGYTDNIGQRVKDHNYSKCSTTKRYLPVELIWYCGFNSKKKALDF